MGNYFLEEQFGRYANIPKYVIPSAAIILLILNFKVSTLIQDSKSQIIRIFDLEFSSLFSSASARLITNIFQRRCSAAGNNGSALVLL